jgi:hypothetical protein
MESMGLMFLQSGLTSKFLHKDWWPRFEHWQSRLRAIDLRAHLVFELAEV